MMRKIVFVLAYWLLIAAGLYVLLAYPFAHAQDATITIPRAAETHKRVLTQQARLILGIDAPVATLAAQIHQESLWRSDAVSRAGAQGMAQFMPATGAWLAQTYKLGSYDPLNPAWAIRAMITYDRHLYRLVAAADDCNRWAKTLSAYNGGLTWISRDENLATREGKNPDYWFGHVEDVNAGRAAWAYRENRAYPRRILLTLEPVYIEAGFGGGICVSQ